MELALLVYLVSVLDKIQLVSIGILLLSCAVVPLSLVCYAHNDDEHSKNWVVRSCVALVVSVVLLTFIPSQKTTYTMIGAYAAQKVAESPETHKITDKIIVIINKELDKLAK